MYILCASKWDILGHFVAGAAAPGARADHALLRPGSEPVGREDSSL